MRANAASSPDKHTNVSQALQTLELRLLPPPCPLLDSQSFVSDRRTRAEEVLVSESIIYASDSRPQLGLRMHERLRGRANRERDRKGN